MNMLKQLRQDKGVLQKDVAFYLGIDRTTYVKYERGDSEPNHDMLSRLADYFNVSVDYLLGRENYRISPDKQLSENEEHLIEAYRNHPELQDAVNRILYIDTKPEKTFHIIGSDSQDVRIAAKGHGTRSKSTNNERRASALKALRNIKEEQ